MSGPKNVKRIVNRRGQYIKIYLDDQENVTVNEYKDIVARPNIPDIIIKAFPIERNPSPKQIEAVGASQTTKVLAYCSMLDLNEIGYTFDDIEQWNARMQIDGEMYKLESANKFSHWEDTFLYIVFAGENAS